MDFCFFCKKNKKSIQFPSTIPNTQKSILTLKQTHLSQIFKIKYFLKSILSKIDILLSQFTKQFNSSLEANLPLYLPRLQYLHLDESNHL